MEKVVKILLYATLITPLFLFKQLFFPFITSKMIPFEGLVLVAALFWLYLWQKNPERYAPKITWLTVALGTYVLIQFIAALQGVNFWRSFWSTFERMDGIFTWLVLSLFFLLVSTLFTKRADWLWALRITLFMSLFANLRAIHFFDIFTGKLPPFYDLVGIYAMFGNSLYLAIYSLAHISVAGILLSPSLFSQDKAAALKEKRRKYWMTFYAITIAVNLVALFLSGGRGPLLGFAGGTFLFIILLLLYGYAKTVLKGLGIVLLLLVFTFPLWRNHLVVQRVISIPSGLAAIKDRVINWQVAIDAFRSRPLLGWGSNTFLIVQNKFFDPKLPSLTREGFDRVHNKYLELAVDAGIAGIVSYVSIFGVIFMGLYKKRREEVFLAAILLGFFTAYLIQNITAFDNPGSYLPLFLLLGFVNFHFLEPLRVQLKVKPWLMAGGWIVIVALSWQGVWQPLRANLVLADTLIEQERKEKNWTRISNGYQKALSYASLGDYEIRTRLGTFMINQQEFPKELLDFAIQELQKEYKLSHSEVLINIILGKLYEKKGFIEKNNEFIKRAEKFFLTALKISPSRPESYEHYVAFLLNEKRGEDARIQLEKIRELNERIYESQKNQWYLGMSYYIDGDFQKAYVQFEKIIESGGTLTYADEFLVLAKTTYELKKYEEMVNWYQRLVASDPNNAQYRIFLAAAYKETGDKARAIDEAQAAVRMDPRLERDAQAFISSL